MKQSAVEKSDTAPEPSPSGNSTGVNYKAPVVVVQRNSNPSSSLPPPTITTADDTAASEEPGEVDDQAMQCEGSPVQLVAPAAAAVSVVVGEAKVEAEQHVGGGRVPAFGMQISKGKHLMEVKKEKPPPKTAVVSCIREKQLDQPVRSVAAEATRGSIATSSAAVDISAITCFEKLKLTSLDVITCSSALALPGAGNQDVVSGGGHNIGVGINSACSTAAAVGDLALSAPAPDTIITLSAAAASSISSATPTSPSSDISAPPSALGTELGTTPGDRPENDDSNDSDNRVPPFGAPGTEAAEVLVQSAISEISTTTTAMTSTPNANEQPAAATSLSIPPATTPISPAAAASLALPGGAISVSPRQSQPAITATAIMGEKGPPGEGKSPEKVGGTATPRRETGIGGDGVVAPPSGDKAVTGAVAAPAGARGTVGGRGAVPPGGYGMHGGFSPFMSPTTPGAAINP